MADYRESDQIFRLLADSSLFVQFRDAFESATDLPLEIHSDQLDFNPSRSTRANPFCRIINEHNRCPDCAAAANCIGREMTTQARAVSCFAGMSESAVPILLGRVPIAWLTTGQVFPKGGPVISWETVRDRLAAMEYSETTIATLKLEWERTRQVAGEQYEGTTSLLAMFAGQLSEHAEKLLLERKQKEPVAITKARQYVSAHLSEPIELEAVATHAGMSQFHFCRVFKNVTGLTFKQYLTRRRIEWAKCRLRKRDARVTEVAYEVGFGSLSQFNRSFLRLVGCSPTDWRKQELCRLVEAS